MSAVAACVGQVFYAYRIFILSRSRIISILVICLSLTSSVAAMIIGIYFFRRGQAIETDVTVWLVGITVGIWCGGSALCDILITICMTYYLTSSTTDFRRTRMLVTRLIRLIIETGSVTVVVASIALILFMMAPHQTFYMTPGLLMPKLYANSIYMVLNSRFQITGGRDTYISSTGMGFTTTMMRDISSQSVGGPRPTDRMEGQGCNI
ncbi:hypothetical protein F5146DRAFT_440658 [Armillaria mellea]|nr:hypothetical protein F5146DRAFT_440658 [Armillaria mellea]